MIATNNGWPARPRRRTPGLRPLPPNAARSPFRSADIKTIAHQVQERVLADEVTGAHNGVAVAQRFGLRDETEAAGMIARYPRVAYFVAG